VGATTETNTGLRIDSDGEPIKVYAVLDENFGILRDIPTTDIPVFNLKNEMNLTWDEATIRNGLLLCMKDYSVFRGFVGISNRHIIVVQSGLPGKPSNARITEYLNGDLLIRVSTKNSPPAPRGAGKWDYRWILRKVCHELAEFVVVRALKSLEHSYGKAEARKIVRDVLVTRYGNDVPSKNLV